MFQENSKLFLRDVTKECGMLIGIATHLEGFTPSPDIWLKVSKAVSRLGNEIKGSVRKRRTSSA